VTLAVRRGLVVAAALLLALLPWAGERAAQPAAAWLLAEARFGETVDDAGQSRRALPHRWAGDCAACRTVWYRFDITLADLPRDAQAVYLAAAADNAAIYLNGRLLAQGGRFSDPVARLGTRALWAATPPSLWAAGPNRIDVLAKADPPSRGFVGTLAVGPESELVGAWRLHEFLGQTLPQWLAMAAVILALAMVLVWFQRRSEPAYALLAGVALAQALQAGLGLVAEPPLRAWDAGLVLCAWVAAAAGFALATRLVGATLPPAAGPAALLAGAAAAVAAAWRPDWAGVLACAPALLAAATGARLLRHGWPAGEARLLVPGVALLLLPLADLGRWLGDPGALPLQPYAAGVFLFAAAWVLLLRFVETLNAVELLNIDLEALVQARTAELHRQFDRVRELEHRQTVAAERERLMRDMHDGVGGHLVSLLAMIEADRRRPADLAAAVREALDDMRLMIDSLEPVDDDLNAVLAMWRDRMAPRLRGAGVMLHWEVELLPSVPGLTPARVLHVLRMLQEAVSNAMRHGRARTLWIRAAAAGGVRIEVRDDGCGFDPVAVEGGRGLKNLRRRAAEIGAALAIDSRPGCGTTVSLELALDGS